MITRLVVLGCVITGEFLALQVFALFATASDAKLAMTRDGSGMWSVASTEANACC